MRLVLLLLASTCAFGEVRLPALLADHMVVQRGLPVHVWGMAEPRENVAVTFRGVTRSDAADELGRWSVSLPPGEAGGPFELTVKASNTITLRDVLVGDVWVGSGQSNMEWSVRASASPDAEIAAAKYPKIRLLTVKKNSTGHPLDDVQAEPWVECSPQNIAEFSAVAYYFGRDLHERLGVPVGLIDSSWGGTPVDAWTSLTAIGSDPALMPAIAEWGKMMNNQAATLLRREQRWKEAVAKAKAEGKPEPARPWEPNLGNSWMPAGLYNAMIAPLTRFPIRGVIWYQGESNASRERAPIYSRLFGAMITDWRRAWGIGDFPFLFVQLANFKTGPESWWPELREQQRRTLALRNTGMAVTIDIGNPDDIHPKNKQDVGKRLALAARALEFGEKVEYSGPMFRTAAAEGSEMRVWFDHAAGLAAKGGALRGFEVAGEDRKFVPAQGRIDGAAVVLSADGVTEPRYVRYGWSDNPDVNLFNGAGLPASPFRSY